MTTQPPQLPDPPPDLFDGFVEKKSGAKDRAVSKLKAYIQQVALGIKQDIIDSINQAG